ncbi:hypothetical protein ACHAWF_004229, partial [Thalassiosira exigua]
RRHRSLSPFGSSRSHRPPSPPPPRGRGGGIFAGDVVDVRRVGPREARRRQRPRRKRRRPPPPHRPRRPRPRPRPRPRRRRRRRPPLLPRPPRLRPRRRPPPVPPLRLLPLNLRVVPQRRPLPRLDVLVARRIVRARLRRALSRRGTAPDPDRRPVRHVRSTDAARVRRRPLAATRRAEAAVRRSRVVGEGRQDLVAAERRQVRPRGESVQFLAARVRLRARSSIALRHALPQLGDGRDQRPVLRVRRLRRLVARLDGLLRRPRGAEPNAARTLRGSDQPQLADALLLPIEERGDGRVEGRHGRPRGDLEEVVFEVQSRVRLRPHGAEGEGRLRQLGDVLSGAGGGGEVHRHTLPLHGGQRRVEVGQNRQEDGHHHRGRGAVHGPGLHKGNPQAPGHAGVSHHPLDRRTASQRGAGIVQRSRHRAEPHGVGGEGPFERRGRGAGRAERRLRGKPRERDVGVHSEESRRAGVRREVDALVPEEADSPVVQRLQLRVRFQPLDIGQVGVRGLRSWASGQGCSIAGNGRSESPTAVHR